MDILILTNGLIKLASIGVMAYAIGKTLKKTYKDKIELLKRKNEESIIVKSPRTRR